MRNLVLASAAIAIMVTTVGCANGPIRNWLRGAPCSVCNAPPQFGAPAGNLLSDCSSGTCGTGTCASGVCSSEPVQATGSGLLGGVFNRSGQGSSTSFGQGSSTSFQGSSTAFQGGTPFQQGSGATFQGSGTVNNNPLPASIPASSFETAPSSLTNNSDLYGNTNTVGRIELPPAVFD